MTDRLDNTASKPMSVPTQEDKASLAMLISRAGDLYVREALLPNGKGAMKRYQEYRQAADDCVAAFKQVYPNSIREYIGNKEAELRQLLKQAGAEVLQEKPLVSLEGQSAAILDGLDAQIYAPDGASHYDRDTFIAVVGVQIPAFYSEAAKRLVPKEP